MKLVDSSKSFFLKCRRVWSVLKKPSKKEFEMTAKVSAIGILALGLVGFLVSLVISPVISLLE